MNDDTADLDRLFARLSGEGHSQDLDDHPTPEKLSAYQANELSPEEDGAIQEHLVHCALCTELLLDLQRFLDPPVEDLPREGVADFEAAAEWRELRGRMGERDVTVDGNPSPRRIRSLRAWQSVAAVLAVGLFALGGYTLALLKDRGAPEPNSITQDLEANGATRSSGGERVNLEGLKKPIDLSLIFRSSEIHAYTSFSADIETEEGVRHIVKGLQPKLEKVSLILPSESVEPGKVTITLWGIRDGRKSKIDVYTMTVIP